MTPLLFCTIILKTVATKPDAYSKLQSDMKVSHLLYCIVLINPREENSPHYVCIHSVFNYHLIDQCAVQYITFTSGHCVI